MRVLSIRVSYLFRREFSGNVPVVHELASIPLKVWSEEHGYTKVQANIFGHLDSSGRTSTSISRIPLLPG